MEPSESITNYISQVLALTNQIKTYGKEYKDKTKAEKILQTLTPNFERIIVALEEVCDLTLITIKELFDTLQAHEQHTNEKLIEKPIVQVL